MATTDLSSSGVRPGVCAAGPPDLARGLLLTSTDDQWHLTHSPTGTELFAQHLRSVHQLLGEAGLEFGHRVFYEATRFAAIFHATGRPDTLEALDLQVMQKVLPRIHGSRRRLEAPLCALGQFCFDLVLDPGAAEPGRPPRFNPLSEVAQPAKLPSLSIRFVEWYEIFGPISSQVSRSDSWPQLSESPSTYLTRSVRKLGRSRSAFYRRRQRKPAFSWI